MQTYPCNEIALADPSIAASLSTVSTRLEPLGRSYRTRATIIALGAILVIFLLAITAVPLPAAGAASGLNGHSATLSTSAFGGCNAVYTPTPSALLQGIAAPAKNETPGGNITATMEFAVVNWTSADSNITVLFPSIFFNFPRASGGNQQLMLSNRSAKLNFSGWSTPSFGQTKPYVFPAGLQFKNNSKAKIDSMKLAVQATADYGQVTLEVRWQWAYQPHPNVTARSPWSTPTTAAHWPTSVPSIFYPAPYTTLLHPNALNGTIGTNWTANLGGDVAGRTFFLEMEDPSGTVRQDLLQTAPANATNYTVHLILLNYNNFLPTGPYLVHIHDACGAMLWSRTVHAVLAPTASLRFVFNWPSACSGKTVTFNGTAYGNNSVGAITPSNTAYNFTLPFCTGHKFSTWQTTGAIHISGGRSMIVNYNGTWTIWYA
ncbi:MAG: hypothetical protein ACHQ16_00345 [Candidatus Lutacidiplasmatales archaeon]